MHGDEFLLQPEFLFVIQPALVATEKAGGVEHDALDAGSDIEGEIQVIPIDMVLAVAMPGRPAARIRGDVDVLLNEITARELAAFRRGCDLNGEEFIEVGLDRRLCRKRLDLADELEHLLEIATHSDRHEPPLGKMGQYPLH